MSPGTVSTGLSARKSPDALVAVGLDGVVALGVGVEGTMNEKNREVTS